MKTSGRQSRMINTAMSNPVTYTRINEDFLDVHQPSEYLNADDVIYDEVRAEIKKMQEDITGDLYMPSIDLCRLPDAYYKPDDHQELWNIVRLVPSTYGLDCNLNWIDVSSFDDLRDTFDGTGFNGDISRWDVSRVIMMNDMFACSAFNGDISKWDVSNVRYMEGMFYQALFNKDISDWDVRQVKTMQQMFAGSQFSHITELEKWSSKIKLNCNIDRMFDDTPTKDDCGKPIILPSFYDNN